MNKNSREWIYKEFKDQNLYSGIVKTIIDNCFFYIIVKNKQKKGVRILLLFRGVYIVIFLILESDALAWNAFDSIWSKAPM